MGNLLEQLVAVALGDQPQEMLHLDAARVRRHADGLQVLVHAHAQRRVVLELEVRLPQVERADVADRHQRVSPGGLRVREDASVQVEVVVGLGLVDVARSAARDRVELLQLDPELGRERAGGDVELLRRQRGEAALVVGDPHASAPPSGSGCPCSRRASARSPWTIPAAPPLSCDLDDVVERPGLLHVRPATWGGNGGGTLPFLARDMRELHLLQRSEHSLRLRHELRLAQPARRPGRVDEPLGVLRAHVAVDADVYRLGAELRDRVARVDALGAALVAEVAARAVPDAVLVVVGLQALDRRLVPRVADEAEALRERSRARRTPGPTPSSCTRRRSSRT